MNDLTDPRAEHSHAAAGEPIYRDVVASTGHSSGPLTRSLPVVSTATVVGAHGEHCAYCVMHAEGFPPSACDYGNVRMCDAHLSEHVDSCGECRALLLEVDYR